MNTPLQMLVCLSLAAVASFANTITVGAPGNPFDGDCAPFGCAVEYQQVYGAGQFPGAIMITDLTFFNDNFVPGSIADANYTISLSSTTAAVDGLDATFANNLGSDNALFFSGPLGGLIGPTNQFTISGTPFTYDPIAGNLLLTVTSDGGGLDFSVFLDFASGAPAGTFSRAYSFDTSGIASNLETDTGLVTQFTFSPVSSTVPEPSSYLLLGAALVAMLLGGRMKARQSKSKAMEVTEHDAPKVHLVFLVPGSSGYASRGPAASACLEIAGDVPRRDGNESFQC